MPDCFEQYIAQVCGQIRWKRAREGLAEELRTHLLDQRDACVAEGLTQAAAEAESLRQMGDPVAVGVQLDRIHRPRPQWDLMALVGSLLLAGLYLQGGILGELADSTGGIRQAVLAVLIGVLLLLAVYWVDYTALGAHPLWISGIGLGVCLISIWKGPTDHGRAVIPYYLSLVCPVLIALLVYGLRGRGWRGVLTVLAAVWGTTVLFLSVPFFAGAGLVLLIGTGLLLLSVRREWMGVPKGRGTAVVSAVAVLPVLLAGLTPAGRSYLKNRLAVALHPETDPLGKGYMAMRVRELLQNAQWMGRGTQVEGAGLLPGGHTNYCLTCTVYRLGWWAGLALVGLLLLFLAVACRRALRHRGMLGWLLSTAAVLTLGGEVALYGASNLGFVLFGAMALPFLSWGGWYMVINLFLAGLLMSVFREEHLPKSPMRVQGGGWRNGRCRISHRDGELAITVTWKSNIK